MLRQPNVIYSSMLHSLVFIDDLSSPESSDISFQLPVKRRYITVIPH